MMWECQRIFLSLQQVGKFKRAVYYMEYLEQVVADVCRTMGCPLPPRCDLVTAERRRLCQDPVPQVNKVHTLSWRSLNKFSLTLKLLTSHVHCRAIVGVTLPPPFSRSLCNTVKPTYDSVDIYAIKISLL